MLIKYGAEGEYVERIQRALNDLGYEVPVTGNFKDQTYQAVREFQRANGLLVDGKVGNNTLQAMGLDPATLESLTSETEEGAIVFTEDEANAPSDLDLLSSLLKEDIQNYVQLVDEQRKSLLDTLLEALQNFETTMSFDSAEDAEADIFGALLSTAFDFGVDMVLERIPGASTAKKFFDATSAELERAGRAKQSASIGQWIQDQRNLLVTQKLQSNQREHQRLQFETEDEYLALDPQDRQKFWDEIRTANEKMRSGLPYSFADLQVKLYEQYINTQYHDNWDEESLSGCIQYRLLFEDGEFELESCRVLAPSRDNIETALNNFLDKRLLQRVRQPIDFKVRKRVCLRTKNRVGGRGWFCGWLDADNNVTDEPNIAEAQVGFNRPDWRDLAERFGD